MVMCEKSRCWYAVACAGDGLRTYRIGQILDLEPLEEVYDPPVPFDLARHWQAHTARCRSGYGKAKRRYASDRSASPASRTSRRRRCSMA
ncbi:WYL domain-containing protein [Streptomyces sp. NPDC047009]|uniref:WYL domain-containing protein n=1 Tax=Streptomyces sp. NPDC047009 TaxID=3154496 RepID=UPI0033F535A7